MLHGSHSNLARSCPGSSPLPHPTSSGPVHGSAGSGRRKHATQEPNPAPPTQTSSSRDTDDPGACLPRALASGRPSAPQPLLPAAPVARCPALARSAAPVAPHLALSRSAAPVARCPALSRPTAPVAPRLALTCSTAPIPRRLALARSATLVACHLAQHRSRVVVSVQGCFKVCNFTTFKHEKVRLQ